MLKIGTKLYELRKKEGISQEEFAEVVAASRQAVSKWERDEAYPDIDKLILIAKYYNCSVDYLLNYETEEQDVNKFIKNVKDTILAGKYLVEIEEIERWILKYPNYYELIETCSEYLTKKAIETKDKAIFEKALDYTQKLIVLAKQSSKDEINIDELKKNVAEIYLFLDRPEDARNYIENNKLKKCANVLSRIEMANKNYQKSLDILSEEYLNNLSDILNTVAIEIWNLFFLKRYKEAYELIDWLIKFVDSIVTKDNALYRINTTHLILKGVIALLLDYDSKDIFDKAEEILQAKKQYDKTTKTFKNYYGKFERIYLYEEYDDALANSIFNEAKSKGKMEVERAEKLYEKYKEEN